MKLLALELSTSACSAALWIDGQVTERFVVAPRQHTALILPMLDELLSAAQLSLSALDALAFGCGPGSFTGLRIAAGVIQGLAFSHDLPVIPISSLRAIAQRHYRQQAACTNLLVCVDALAQTYYWGHYQVDAQGYMQGTDQISALASMQIATHSAPLWLALGAGTDAHAIAATLHIDPQHISTADGYPHAANIAELAVPAYQQGQVLPAAHAVPVYLQQPYQTTAVYPIKEV